MCTLMEKDVMIEALSSYLGEIARRRRELPSEQLKADWDALLERRDHIYSTKAEELSWLEWFDWSEPYHQTYYGTPRVRPPVEAVKAA